MPFYEYRRPDGTTFEIMQKMSDPPLAEDPETGLPVTRVFHPIAVHFKGKGFYNTDYGTKNRQREKAESDGADKKAESGATKDSSSDSSSSKEASKPEASKGASSSSSSSSSESAKSSKS